MGRAGAVPGRYSARRIGLIVVRLYFDSNIFIYAFECETDFGHAARRAFRLIETGQVTAVTSELTLAEVLPGPLRSKDMQLEEAYETIFAGGSGFDVVPLSMAVLRDAARLVADSRLRLADALHVATALRSACAAFLTEALRAPAELRMMRLADERFE